MGGEPVTKYKELDEQYDVWLRADLAGRDRPSAVARLMIPSPKAGLVQLSSVAALEPQRGPATIDRYAMQRQVGVNANLQDGVAFGNAVRHLDEHVKEMGLPLDYRSEFLGRAKMLNESNDNFLLAFLASFLFMYMILAAQFESFIHPITILLALPLTLPFALGFADPLADEPGHLCHVRPVHALRDRQEERHLAGRLHQCVAGEGIPAERGDPGGQPHAAPADPHDDGDAHRGNGSHRLGPRSRRRVARSLAKVVLGGQTLSLLLTLLLTPVAYSLWDDLSRIVSQLAARFRRSEEEPALDEDLGESLDEARTGEAA